MFQNVSLEDIDTFANFYSCIVLSLDKDLRVISINENGQHLLDCSQSDIVGLDFEAACRKLETTNPIHNANLDSLVISSSYFHKRHESLEIRWKYSLSEDKNITLIGVPFEATITNDDLLHVEQVNRLLGFNQDVLAYGLDGNKILADVDTNLATAEKQVTPIAPQAFARFISSLDLDVSNINESDNQMLSEFEQKLISKVMQTEDLEQAATDLDIDKQQADKYWKQINTKLSSYNHAQLGYILGRIS